MRLVPHAATVVACTTRSGTSLVPPWGGGQKSVEQQGVVLLPLPCYCYDACGCLTSFSPTREELLSHSTKEKEQRERLREGDAVRLLRARRRAGHGRVGASVFAFAAARSAGLQPGTSATGGVVAPGVGGALTGTSTSRRRSPRVALGRGPYRLAPAAMRMLARA